MSTRTRRPAIIEDDLAKIPLGVNAKDGYAVVDKKYAHLSKDNWRKTHFGYVIRSRDKKLLHRVILNTPKGLVADHINGDPLDNRVGNIRNCTQAQNTRNSKVKKNSSSGIKGVYYWEARGKWVAKIKSNYKAITIGYYSTAGEAYKAYSDRAIQLHGEFAGVRRG